MHPLPAPEPIAVHGAGPPLAARLWPAPPGSPGVVVVHWHAAGDEQVPWTATAALARATRPPARLEIVPGGGHRTLQHDPAVLADTVAFLREHLAA